MHPKPQDQGSLFHLFVVCQLCHWGIAGVLTPFPSISCLCNLQLFVPTKRRVMIPCVPTTLLAWAAATASYNWRPWHHEQDSNPCCLQMRCFLRVDWEYGWLCAPNGACWFAVCAQGYSNSSADVQCAAWRKMPKLQAIRNSARTSWTQQMFPYFHLFPLVFGICSRDTAGQLYTAVSVGQWPTPMIFRGISMGLNFPSWFLYVSIKHLYSHFMIFQF